jgi:hypothetical protein
VTVYGDAEPEDAWHPDDPIHELLDNLGRRCAILGEPPNPPTADISDRQRLVELEHRLHRLIVRRDTFDARGRVRVDLIARHVAELRTRLEAASG